MDVRTTGHLKLGTHRGMKVIVKAIKHVERITGSQLETVAEPGKFGCIKNDI